jgi:hypothetical protein
VNGWHQDGPASYALAVSEPAAAAPAVTRALVAVGADVLSISESHRSLVAGDGDHPGAVLRPATGRCLRPAVVRIGRTQPRACAAVHAGNPGPGADLHSCLLGGRELWARPAVASALIGVPDLLAQLLFTPLVAGWSVWIAIAISTRSDDVRVAQQLASLASLPSIALTTLVALNVIHASLRTAAIAAAALLLLNCIPAA